MPIASEAPAVETEVGGPTTACAGAGGGGSPSAAADPAAATTGPVSEASEEGVAGSSPPLLTSGNLMQLHASLSSRAVDGEDNTGLVRPEARVAVAGGGPAEVGYGGGGGDEVGNRGVGAEAAEATAGGVEAGRGQEEVGGGTAAVSRGIGEERDSSASGMDDEGVSAAAAVVAPAAPEATLIGGGVATAAATRPGGHAAWAEEAPGGRTAPSPLGRGDGLETGARHEGPGEAVAAVADVPVHGAVLEPTDLHAGEVSSGGRSGRGSSTLRSDSSVDGVSCTATQHQHQPHWEHFTNNDIVDQVPACVVYGVRSVVGCLLPSIRFYFSPGISFLFRGDCGRRSFFAGGVGAVGVVSSLT